MSLRHVILGLVVEQPRHGYALQAALEESFGELCDPGPGEVYRVLASLKRDGLVAASTARVGRRPRRKVYAPTAAGRRALGAWLRDDRALAARSGRDEPWLRILVAARVAPGLLRALVEAQVEGRRRALHALEASRPERFRSNDLLALVLALRHESALQTARAALRVTELCLDLVARHGEGVPAGELVARVACDGGGAAQRKAPSPRSGATG